MIAIVQCDDEEDFFETYRETECTSHSRDGLMLAFTDVKSVTALADGRVRVRRATDDLYDIGQKGTGTGSAEIVQAFTP